MNILKNYFDTPKMPISFFIHHIQLFILVSLYICFLMDHMVY